MTTPTVPAPTPKVAKVTLRLPPDAGGGTFDVEDNADYETVAFQWTEGNYGCDCNRSLFLQRAGHLAGDEHWPCGERIKLVAIAVDGKEIYRDREQVP